MNLFPSCGRKIRPASAVLLSQVASHHHCPSHHPATRLVSARPLRSHRCRKGMPRCRCHLNVSVATSQAGSQAGSPSSSLTTVMLRPQAPLSRRGRSGVPSCPQWKTDQRLCPPKRCFFYCFVVQTLTGIPSVLVAVSVVSAVCSLRMEKAKHVLGAM
jgi:hypothetical protein